MVKRISDRERGFTLAGLIVILTILMIFIAYTVPRQWSAIMRRERERQTIFVMKQYARAIYDYQIQKHATPSSMDQLTQARLPRLLRGPKGGFVDPLTNQMDWLIITAAAAQAGSTVPTGVPPSTTSTSTTNPPVTAPPAIPAKDYAGGPFVGVRPPMTGDSLMTFNGATRYEQWSYTSIDFERDLRLRTAAPGSTTAQPR